LGKLFVYEKFLARRRNIPLDQHTDSEGPVYSVPPVIRAIAVLRYVAAGNRCRSMSKASKALGINRTTMIRLIGTLLHEGMIEEIPDGGGYRLGTGLIALAYEALNERGVVQVSRPFLIDLVRELNLSSHLGVLEGREIVYLVRQTPNSHLASNVREGTRLPAHATTIGRILLAQMPREALRLLYANTELQAFTAKTRTTLPELEAQLAEDRAKGIAWSMANFEPEIGSAAMPVFDYQGKAVAAINVTGHASVFERGNPQLRDIERALREAARGISEALGYRGWASDQM
jgi:DNA-binding IclR family transcriptional regulator